MSFSNYKNKLNTALTNTSNGTSLKDIGKVAGSTINNEFNKDEKTKKIINKALGTLEVDDLISNNSDGGYRDWETATDRKSTRLNSSHSAKSRMPSSA